MSQAHPSRVRFLRSLQPLAAAALALCAVLATEGRGQQVLLTPLPNAPVPVAYDAGVLDRASIVGDKLVWRQGQARSARAVALLVGPYAGAPFADLPPTFVPGACRAGRLLPLWPDPQPGAAQLELDVSGIAGSFLIQ